jgi:hypothetical protein
LKTEFKPYTEINKCRICGNSNLKTILNLGEQALSGVFPFSKNQSLTSGPLELVKCIDNSNTDNCGLVQLKQTYNLFEMYGDHYGYRSGLNSSMVNHLKHIAEKNLSWVILNQGDLIIDIGSNDATLLKSYPSNSATLIGIDPLSKKFREFYTENIYVINDFFSSVLIRNKFGNQKAKIITSIAMFYDLEAPLEFMQNVYDILHDDGIWVFEQSYMPLMLEKNAYDTVCHEHLEYYGLKQIQWMLNRVGLKVIDIDINDTNGGSFRLTVAKNNSRHKECKDKSNEILEKEKLYSTLVPFENFEKNIHTHRNELLKLIQRLRGENKRIFGYGASTKGNVLLQYCRLSTKEIEYIGEVNVEKYGAYTPKTWIPIISEKEAKEKKPDYFLVLPWHFKENILLKEEKTIKQGTHFIFPLPKIEVY